MHRITVELRDDIAAEEVSGLPVSSICAKALRAEIVRQRMVQAADGGDRLAASILGAIDAGRATVDSAIETAVAYRLGE